MRELDLAERLFCGPGKRAAFIAEQLRLQQILRNGGAIDGLKFFGAPRTQIVYRPRQQFLAGAAFAEYQHIDIGGRHFLDDAAHLQHRRIRGQQAIQWRGVEGGPAALQFLLQFIDPKCPGHQQFQDIDVHGFLAKVECALFDRHECVVAVIVAGNHDYLGARREFEHL